MAKLKEFRLLVTGSRTWTNEEVLKEVLSRYYRAITSKYSGFGKEPILVHGTAHGVDEMAAKIWLELGGAVEPHPADWDKFGKQAGFVRNAEMIDSGVDMCLAFIKNGSKGATQCSKLAERRGIKTTLFEDNE